VKIEGHCDAAGSDEYNYALGLRRAKATKDALTANGISSNNITLVSMGESAPECAMNSSADCYAKNRRVEFKVMQ
jgi:peptidoglycan-associated lipoprotein